MQDINIHIITTYKYYISMQVCGINATTGKNRGMRLDQCVPQIIMKKCWMSMRTKWSDSKASFKKILRYLKRYILVP